MDQATGRLGNDPATAELSLQFVICLARKMVRYIKTLQLRDFGGRQFSDAHLLQSFLVIVGAGQAPRSS